LIELLQESQGFEEKKKNTERIQREDKGFIIFWMPSFLQQRGFIPQFS